MTRIIDDAASAGARQQLIDGRIRQWRGLGRLVADEIADTASAANGSPRVQGSIEAHEQIPREQRHNPAVPVPIASEMERQIRLETEIGEAAERFVLFAWVAPNTKPPNPTTATAGKCGFSHSPHTFLRFHH
jgi:hypothetical protein